MDLDEIKALGQFGMEMAVAQMEAKGEFSPFFHLVLADHMIETHSVEGDVMNNGAAKDALSKMMKARAKERRAVGVVFCSDIYVTLPTPGSEEIVMRAAQRGGNDLVNSLIGLGLVRKTEAILVSIETPLYVYMGIQYYTRSGRKITLGQKTEHDSLNDGLEHQKAGMETRFGGFFTRV